MTEGVSGVAQDSSFNPLDNLRLGTLRYGPCVGNQSCLKGGAWGEGGTELERKNCLNIVLYLVTFSINKPGKIKHPYKSVQIFYF